MHASKYKNKQLTKFALYLALLVFFSFFVSAQDYYRQGDSVGFDLVPEAYPKVVKQTGFEKNFEYRFNKTSENEYRITVCHKDFQRNRNAQVGRGQARRLLNQYRAQEVDKQGRQKPGRAERRLDLRNNRCDSTTYRLHRRDRVKFGEETTIIELTQDNATFFVTPEDVKCDYLSCHSNLRINNLGDQALDLNISTLSIDIENAPNANINILFDNTYETNLTVLNCTDDECTDTNPELRPYNVTSTYNTENYGMLQFLPGETKDFKVHAVLNEELTSYKYNVSIYHANQWWILDPFFNTTNTTFNSGTYYNTKLNESGYVELNITKTNGTYLSQVYNAGLLSSWDQFSFTLNPITALPNNSVSETAPFGANMTSNSLLLHMDESSGNILDYSGAGQVGIPTNINYGNEGVFNEALYFDGSSSYLNYSDYLNYERTDPFSVFMWIKFNNTGDVQDLIGKREEGTPDQRGWTFVIASTDVMGLLFRNTVSTNDILILSDNALPTDTWISVGFTYTGSSNAAGMTLYVNGTQFPYTVSRDGLTSTMQSSAPLIVGSWHGNDNYFNGLMDEVSVYNRTLTSAEMRNLHLRGAVNHNVSVRSCDDASCNGETYTTLPLQSPQTLSVANNQYFQYKVEFDSYYTNYSSSLFNTSIQYTSLIDDFQTLTVNVVNNSVVNLSNVASFASATFTSWNESTLNLELFINGTSEDNNTASNNTLSTFTISSINETGFYRLYVESKYNTSAFYDFEVRDTQGTPIQQNLNFIPIAIILVGIVGILAYLARTSENEIFKMFFSTLTLISLTGLSHVSWLISFQTVLANQLSTVISWFTITFAFVTFFVIVYTVFTIIVYVLTLVGQLSELRKDGVATKDAFRMVFMNRDLEDGPFK